MPDDPPIGPIEPVGADPVEPVGPRARPPVAAPAASDRAGPSAAPSLGVRATHEQIEHPVLPPRGVNVAADVHDSAAHGNPIAAAIERAHSADPTDRAQVLGGAAASAASGQAAQVDRSATDEQRDRDAVDPLGPVDAVDPDRGGRPGGDDPPDDDADPGTA